jgi:hypothetical protein
LPDQHINVLFEVAEIDYVVDAGAGLSLVQPPDTGGELQVRADGHVRVQRDRLGEVADVPAPLQRIVSHVVVGYPDIPSGGHEVAGENAHRGGLARPVGSQQTNDLALLDIEADIVDGEALAVVLGEILDSDHFLARRPSQTGYIRESWYLSQASVSEP